VPLWAQAGTKTVGGDERESVPWRNTAATLRCGLTIIGQPAWRYWPLDFPPARSIGPCTAQFLDLIRPITLNGRSPQNDRVARNHNRAQRLL